MPPLPNEFKDDLGYEPKKESEDEPKEESEDESEDKSRLSPEASLEEVCGRVRNGQHNYEKHDFEKIGIPDAEIKLLKIHLDIGFEGDDEFYEKWCEKKIKTSIEKSHYLWRAVTWDTEKKDSEQLQRIEEIIARADIAQYFVQTRNDHEYEVVPEKAMDCCLQAIKQEI